MLILSERTPNPDALKFIPQAPLTRGASRWFELGRFEAVQSPLAARLCGLEGVRRVFIAADFVTVTRDADGPPWAELRFQVIAAIADQLQDGGQVMQETAPAPEAEDEIEQEIRQALGRYVKPGVSRDGGDVVFDHFDPATGVLWVKLEGACGGCPSSRSTLKNGVEQIVRRYVPEVLKVEEAPSTPTAPREPWWKKLKSAPAETGKRTVFTHAGKERA